MADLNGSDLRRLLASAEYNNDSAIFFGSRQVKTPCSKSRALLVCVTRCDHFVLFCRVAADCSRLACLLGRFKKGVHFVNQKRACLSLSRSRIDPDWLGLAR